MNEDSEDLVAALSAVDPIDLEALPRPDRALFEEIVTMEPTETPVSNRTSRPRRAWLGAAAVVALGGIGVGAAALAHDDKVADPPTTDAPDTTSGQNVSGIEPAPRTGQFAGSSLSSCLVWDVSNLDLTEYAFDGTVSAIDNGWVTFDVGEAFKGDLGATVVLNAELLMAGPDGGAVTSVSEVLITAVGERFLVSGSDGYAGVCNQTQAYDAVQADAWHAQLRG
jgi:hypothetical protein